METSAEKNLLTLSMKLPTTVGTKQASRLSQLIEGFPVLNAVGTLEKEISSITFDSRKATPGSLFVAIHGLKQDGSRFIQDALKRGASAFISELPVHRLNELGLESGDTTALCVEDSRKALAWVSAIHYRHPSRNMGVIGITGTNGKTTLTYILEALYQTRNVKTGVIGTINYRYADFEAPASVTTPESLDINRMLRDMAEKGITDCFLEVSSHSLALKRVHALNFSLGVFTNLSRDHLDFHVTMEHYKNAKKGFFRDHSMEKQVINIDDPVGREIVRETGRPTLTTGIDQPADVKAEDYVLSESGSRFVLKTPSGSREMHTPLLGKHNIYNLLSGSAAAYFQGFSLDEIEQGLEAAECIPGRFESIDCGQDFSVVVDYAHTHEALENALTAATTLTSNNIIVVFGCGGDRDRGKRKEMGRVALEMGDFAVITSDNPRTEDPKRILDDIVAGVPSSARENRDYKVIENRRQAIEYAVAMARPGDLVLIAGKGHEDYQILGSEKIHFDDREIAAEAINQRMKVD
ncbi:MAG: UDP-N-acetylmuramoyl-L-alanyl-D-glutamate--2, 6-diaminopimelate ligase [Nitrospinaceae bacterium]|nr:MAG: UDP-N-acetylmuramoyl-L-alanyl-D-glutamate--2, 6-diaminopimelate ligase [Nitrospinaceae bacterium]